MVKSEKRIAYEKEYWRTHKQIKVVVTNTEWKTIEIRAKTHDKTVGQLLLAESKAYQKGVYLPTTKIENQLQEISRLIRNIGGLLNQLAKHSNYLRRAVDDRKVLQMLQRLESGVEEMVSRAWQPPRKL